MTFIELVSQYGQVAIFLGSAIEGETVAFFGGVAARRAVISYPQAAVAASLGSFLADEMLFISGRYATHTSIVRRFAEISTARRITDLLEKHPAVFILSFRFIYGIRTVSPVIIGMSNVSTIQFVVFNAISAGVWGTTITGIGYFFGGLVERFFGRLGLYEHLAIGLLCAVLAALALALSCRSFVKINR